MEEQKTITLRKPVTLGTGDGAITYPKLELREPTAGELEKAARADTPVGVMINLISLITAVPRAAVEKISRRDLEEATAYLSGFTNPGESTDGAT